MDRGRRERGSAEGESPSAGGLGVSPKPKLSSGGWVGENQIAFAPICRTRGIARHGYPKNPLTSSGVCRSAGVSLLPHDLDHDLPLPRPDIEVDMYDLLPGAQR